jgi:1-acyl-sn-glycerol-3-phosphate acyltransferase
VSFREKHECAEETPVIALYHATIYYGTLLVFGVVGLALHLCCLIGAWVPPTRRTELFFQRLIHQFFATLVAWFEFTRVCRIDYRGWTPLTRRGLVIAANHPGLLDAVYLIARVPEAVCIFKGSIRRNPVFGAARGAGYLANDGGLGLVREASAKVAAGATLVVFPEGTRTMPGENLGSFRPGFAAIARRAGVPVQLVRIACDSNLLTKGRAWWKLPRLPARVTIAAGPVLDPAGVASSAELTAEAEAWFRDSVEEKCRSRVEALEFAPDGHTLTAS